MLIESILIAVFGIIIGSIINVLADDLPQYQQPRLPRYPDDQPRRVIAWVSLIAFLTGNRTSPVNNTSQLSWRYPIVEITCAVLFVATLLRIDVLNNTETTINTVQTLFWLFYVAMFVLVTVTDLEHHLILFSIMVPSAIVALLDALLTPAAGPFPWWSASASPTLIPALIGGGLGFGMFYFFYLGGMIYTRVSARMRGYDPDEVAFGYGDVMLITVCGLILGWQPLIFTIIITVFLGAFGAAMFLLIQRLRGGEGNMQSALPYGPYIVIGTITMLLFSDWIRQTVLNLAYG